MRILCGALLLVSGVLFASTAAKAATHETAPISMNGINGYVGVLGPISEAYTESNSTGGGITLNVERSFGFMCGTNLSGVRHERAGQHSRPSGDMGAR